jgi:stearoyl-CoA desaturase (delta-9 desaturase)
VVVGVHAIALLAPFVACSWKLVGIALATFLLQTWGITAGYHRYFSHHAFKTSRPVQFVLAWLGCAAMQNGPLWWASGHRRHHRFSDRPGDPHSPVLNGLWHAHLGWVLGGEHDHPDLANVREFARFAELRFLDRFKWLPTFVTGGVWAFAYGLPGVVWGLGVATTLAFHAPLFVNSVGHRWGSRRFDTNDSSRNNALLGVLVLGEGWHNNHHRDPSCARHGFAWWEVDVTYYVLWCLAVVGLVWDVRGRTSLSRVGHSGMGGFPGPARTPRSRHRAPANRRSSR